MKSVLSIAVAAASLLLVGCGTDPAAPPTTTTTTTTTIAPPSSGLAAGCYTDNLRESVFHDGIQHLQNSNHYVTSTDCTGVIAQSFTMLGGMAGPAALAVCQALLPGFTAAIDSSATPFGFPANTWVCGFGI